MARRLNESEARDEAIKYLRLALSLLDDAHEAKAAIHAATALDIASRSSTDDLKADRLVPAADPVPDDDFTIDWGVLVPHTSAKQDGFDD